MERLGPLTADDLLQRREELRELEIPIDLEELSRGASPEVRAEFLDRLARIEEAEREFEASWWSDGEADESDLNLDQPRGVDRRYVEPQIREQGGMGYLCSAFDVELNRLVAYKVMKPPKGERPRGSRRFFNEAEITSRLNHPGVVPVYGRVIDDSGLPAYASAFVSGRSLAWRIDEYRRIDPRDRDARAEARASLLRSFLAVCEIIAYAHSERIVHGDVKPLNIMTDSFGATRLVDWGLARIVDENEVGGTNAEEATIPRPGTLGFLSSIEGQPTYASDVFSLGRTLAMILEEVATRSSPSPRPAADAPRALWAVAEKAMRPDGSERYASASALADDVRAVLADRAIAVYRDPWSTRLRRWAGRNRPAVVATAALLLAVVAVGPIIGFRERELRRRADAERNRAVDLTREMLDQADHIGKFQATLPGSREMLDRAVRLIEQLAKDAETAGDDLAPAAESFYRAGRINQVLGRLEGAADCFRKAADLAGRFVRDRTGEDHAADLDRRARALREWGVVQVQRGRPAEADTAWREASEILVPVASRSSEHRLTQARILYAIGNSQMIRQDQAGAQAKFAEARAILEPLVQADGSNPRLVKALSDVYSNLGFSLFRQAAPGSLRVINPDRLAEAKRAHAEALRLRRLLTQLEPGTPEHVSDVALSLNLLGNASLAEGVPGYETAADYYLQAADLLKTLVLTYPSVRAERQELAQVYTNLNAVRAGQGRLEEARSASNSAVELFTKLAEDQPDSPGPLSDLGVALMQQSRTLSRVGDNNGASSTKYQAALAMARASSMNGDPGRRDGLAKQAVALLNELNRQGYFRQGRAAELANEPRFESLRRRPDFPKP